jgi:fatty acid synthase
MVVFSYNLIITFAVKIVSYLKDHINHYWFLIFGSIDLFLQSFYALLLRGRVTPGEWVLIHTGASAVGQAAIAMCLHTGCNVITTVLNEKEYRSVKSLFKHLSGLHVMQYSDMEDQVLALTGGCGVDVIFNTLHSSDWCHSLLHCLTRDGRFLDLAVPSFSKNKALGEKLS